MDVAKQLLVRGVWEADFLVDGCRVLQAIDSRGNCIRRVKLAPDVNDEIAEQWLLGLLERMDPRPTLRLIKPDPAPLRMRADLFARLMSAGMLRNARR